MSYNGTKTPCKPTKKAKWHVPMRPNPKSGMLEYYLDGELKERFCKLFPKHSNRRLMEWFGLSHSTLQRFKREFGLRKDMTAIRKELARDVKRICEKNGYYASIRGRQPSVACMEAARELWAGGFHPMRQIKENAPRKYKRLLKRRSEDSKKLYEAERLRASYGLERKTRLRIPECPMTHHASSQKNSMIRNNNYFADPNNPWRVCYDGETRRSERREETAKKCGLELVNCE